MEDYIKCGLFGKGSPRHLDTFLTFLLLTVHYTYQYIVCVVGIVDYIHVHHVVHNKIITSCCY